MVDKIGDVQVMRVSEVTLENLVAARKIAVTLETEKNRLKDFISEQTIEIADLKNEKEELELQITELKSRLFTSRQETANVLSMLRDYHVAYNALHHNPTTVNKQQIESVDAKVLALLTHIITAGGKIKFAEQEEGNANDNDVTTGG